MSPPQPRWLPVPDTTLINIYCDESCHLEGDGIPVMVLGGIACPAGHVERLSETIRSIKRRHSLSSSFETKWTKVSPAKLDYYIELIDFFLAERSLTARLVVVPDKGVLDHRRFAQSHDDWYYKMYYTLLKPVVQKNGQYRIYLDIKDTRGGSKTKKLHEVLCNSHWDFNRECIKCVQQIRSHESEILQLTDLLVGAAAYANRGQQGSLAKSAIVNHLNRNLGQGVLQQTSYLSTRKLNVLVWEPGR